LPSPCVKGNMETGGRTRRERKSSIARGRGRRGTKKDTNGHKGEEKRRDSWKGRRDKVGGGRIVLTDCPQARASHFFDTAVQPDGAARHASVTSSRGSRSREAGRSRRGSVGAQGTAARASASGQFLSCSGCASRKGRLPVEVVIPGASLSMVGRLAMKACLREVLPVPKDAEEGAGRGRHVRGGCLRRAPAVPCGPASKVGSGS
jgi:hypothetical protein